MLLFDAIVPGENDYSPILTRIKSARPDVAYYSGYYPEGAALVRQARDLNVGVPFLLGGSNYDPKFLELAGAAAEGVIITGSVVPPTLDPSGQDYVKAYKARFGSEPGAFGHWAYDSVQVLAKAIRDTGSVDAAKLKEAVHAIAGFKGVSGEITFTPNGDRKHAPLARLVVKSGRFQLAEQP
ncbi:MAG: branched-chain amino acid ABC transporter substrate-binding protein [Clostridia bacterium]|nr:branched-chain amino acid ABC transporter substrate-binding protein [Clostridia bacterium]